MEVQKGPGWAFVSENELALVWVNELVCGRAMKLGHEWDSKLAAMLAVRLAQELVVLMDAGSDHGLVGELAWQLESLLGVWMVPAKEHGLEHWKVLVLVLERMAVEKVLVKEQMKVLGLGKLLVIQRANEMGLGWDSQLGIELAHVTVMALGTLLVHRSAKKLALHWVQGLGPRLGKGLVLLWVLHWVRELAPHLGKGLGQLLVSCLEQGKVLPMETLWDILRVLHLELHLEKE
jgi:hypothetical protein